LRCNLDPHPNLPPQAGEGTYALLLPTLGEGTYALLLPPPGEGRDGGAALNCCTIPTIYDKIVHIITIRRT